MAVLSFFPFFVGRREPMAGMRQIIENQYLSQSPLEIFSIFLQTPMLHKSLIFSSAFLLSLRLLAGHRQTTIDIAISFPLSIRFHGNGISFFITQRKFFRNISLLMEFFLLRHLFGCYKFLLFRRGRAEFNNGTVKLNIFVFAQCNKQKWLKLAEL